MGRGRVQGECSDCASPSPSRTFESMRRLLCRSQFAFPTARARMTTRAGASLRSDDVREISEMRTPSLDLQDRRPPRISNRQSIRCPLSTPVLAVASSSKYIYFIRLRYIGETVQNIQSHRRARGCKIKSGCCTLDATGPCASSTSPSDCVDDDLGLSSRLPQRK